MNKNTNKSKIFLTPKFFQQTFFQTIISSLRKNVFNERYRTTILFVVLGLLAADIFLSSTSSDAKFFGITILFYITAFFYRLKSNITFIICLVLLGLMFVYFLLSGTSNTTEKIAVWLFLFIAVGIIQQWKE